MDNVRKYRMLAIPGIALLVLFVAIHAAYAMSSTTFAAQDDGESIETELGTTAPSCRFGAAITNGDQTPYLETIGAGWYLNFSISAPPAPNGAEFVPVIIVRQNKSGATYQPGYTATPPLTDAGLGARIDSNPGAIWIVGNEVDRGPDPDNPAGPRIQGDTYPGVYAQAYHDIYHYIKQRDPSALVAVSALVQVTPGRIQYLNMVYDRYLDRYGTPMPVDVWNMHLYVLPEVHPNGAPNNIANIALGTDPALGISEAYDPSGNNNPGRYRDSCPFADVYCYAEHDSMDAFREQVVRMRQWMASHGYRNKPLILSEYSLLLPYAYPDNGGLFQDEFGNTFNPTRVQTFMSETLNYLSTVTDPSIGYPADNNKLVQQWLWFSVYNEGVGEVSNLIDASGNMTNLGMLFRDRVEAEPNTINLYPQRVSTLFAYSDGTGTADVVLEAVVGNNGTQTAAPFEVTFYRDQARTQVIGSATVTGLTGCSTRTISVSVPWEDLSPGLHYYWVAADSGSVVTEQSESDNVRRGSVFVDGELSFLPSISK